MPSPSEALNPLPPQVQDFLLAEDRAIKAHVSGLKVSDGVTGERNVPVFFAHPDPEVREQTYPYIVVEMLFADEDRDRTMSGYGELTRLPYGVPQPTESEGYGPLEGTQVLPMIVTYQISTWARMPRHDRSIAAQLMSGPLNPRFAAVGVEDDSTARRLEVAFNGKRDGVEENKRLYRSVWTVRMPSEMFYSPLTLTRRAEDVIISSESSLGSLP